MAQTKLQIKLLEKISQVMQDKKINKSEVARRTGVSRQAVAIMLSYDKVSIDKLVEILSVLGVEVDVMFRE